MHSNCILRLSPAFIASPSCTLLDGPHKTTIVILTSHRNQFYVVRAWMSADLIHYDGSFAQITVFLTFFPNKCETVAPSQSLNIYILSGQTNFLSRSYRSVDNLELIYIRLRQYKVWREVKVQFWKFSSSFLHLSHGIMLSTSFPFPLSHLHGSDEYPAAMMKMIIRGLERNDEHPTVRKILHPHSCTHAWRFIIFLLMVAFFWGSKISLKEK